MNSWQVNLNKIFAFRSSLNDNGIFPIFSAMTRRCRAVGSSWTRRTRTTSRWFDGRWLPGSTSANPKSSPSPLQCWLLFQRFLSIWWFGCMMSHPAEGRRQKTAFSVMIVIRTSDCIRLSLSRSKCCHYNFSRISRLPPHPGLVLFGNLSVLGVVCMSFKIKGILLRSFLIVWFLLLLHFILIAP